ncbi:uncharacterized protein BDZ99DRAFT_546057, partial [Mytilinidion resinicola]
FPLTTRFPFPSPPALKAFEISSPLQSANLRSLSPSLMENLTQPKSEKRVCFSENTQVSIIPVELDSFANDVPAPEPSDEDCELSERMWRSATEMQRRVDEQRMRSKVQGETSAGKPLPSSNRVMFQKSQEDRNSEIEKSLQDVKALGRKLERKARKWFDNKLFAGRKGDQND